jgi:serine/threonine protein kinase
MTEINALFDLAYRKGEKIGGKYTVIDVLGKGGFGVVYHVRDSDDNRELALKTFRDEFILDPRVKRQFREEALIWIALGRHTFILQADAVHEFDGRLFVAMEFIEPDEHGLTTLQDQIEFHGRKLTNRMIGVWALQFCNGMVHANANGVKAHRDLKPSNLLWGQGPFLKISDFGIAASLQAAEMPAPLLSTFERSSSRQQGNTMCGTLGYIAPEIFGGRSADIRSDIYSFGAVLWQLTSGSPQPPFWERLRKAPDERSIYSILSESKCPETKGAFFNVISRCLQFRPQDRYQDFDEFKKDVKEALDRSGGGRLDFIVNTDPSFSQLVAQGASLRTLGRLDEALECYEAAIRIEPNNPVVWVNKGNVLSSLKKPADSMRSYERALQLDPACDMAWINKGIQLHAGERYVEAVQCFDQVIRLNPQHGLAWNRKGKSLVAQNQIKSAIDCYEKAIEADPVDGVACTNMADALSRVGDGAAAFVWYERALAINSKSRNALVGKAELLIGLSRFDEALQFLEFALKLDPDDFATLNMKAIVLCRLKRLNEAVSLFDYLLKNSQTDLDVAWTNKGNALAELGNWRDALVCYGRALDINPNYELAIRGRKRVLIDRNDT